MRTTLTLLTVLLFAPLGENRFLVSYGGGGGNGAPVA